VRDDCHSTSPVRRFSLRVISIDTRRPSAPIAQTVRSDALSETSTRRIGPGTPVSTASPISTSRATERMPSGARSKTVPPRCVRGSGPRCASISGSSTGSWSSVWNSNRHRRTVPSAKPIAATPPPIG
jgi:hypothetical protein